MSREELIEKMLDAGGKVSGCQIGDFTPLAQEGIRKGMAAALDVAAEELRGRILEERCERQTPWDAAVKHCAEIISSAYLKPKSDPAVEGVKALLSEHAGHAYGLLSPDLATKILAAVRAADKGAN